MSARSDTLNNRGLAHRKIGDIERAVIDYTAAIAASPLYALAYNNRGYAFEAMAKKAEAVQDFRRALSIDPSLSGARIALERLGAAGDLAAQAFHLTKEGKTLAEKNCAWCHVIEMQDNSSNPDAPPFRDLTKAPSYAPDPSRTIGAWHCSSSRSDAAVRNDKGANPKSCGLHQQSQVTWPIRI